MFVIFLRYQLPLISLLSLAMHSETVNCVVRTGYTGFRLKGSSLLSRVHYIPIAYPVICISWQMFNLALTVIAQTIITKLYIHPCTRVCGSKEKFVHHSRTIHYRSGSEWIHTHSRGSYLT